MHVNGQWSPKNIQIERIALMDWKFFGLNTNALKMHRLSPVMGFRIGLHFLSRKKWKVTPFQVCRQKSSPLDIEKRGFKKNR